MIPFNALQIYCWMKKKKSDWDTKEEESWDSSVADLSLFEGILFKEEALIQMIF